MNYETGLMYFNNMVNGVAKDEEVSMLNEYTDLLIGKMSEDVISLDEQEFLDNYINYLRDIVSYMDLVDKYDKVIYIKNDLRLQEEQIAKEKGEVKVLKLNYPNNGIVLTSVILEVVITLGIVIGILVLALKQILIYSIFRKRD